MKNECWLCGKVHESLDCDLNDEWYAQQANFQEDQKRRGICALCDRESPNGDIHADCHATEQYWADKTVEELLGV